MFCVYFQHCYLQQLDSIRWLYGQWVNTATTEGSSKIILVESALYLSSYRSNCNSYIMLDSFHSDPVLYVCVNNLSLSVVKPIILQQIEM